MNDHNGLPVQKRAAKQDRRVICRVCGHVVPQTSGRGRHRVVHEACSKVERAQTLLAKALMGLKGQPFTETAERRLRGDLWTMGNELNYVVLADTDCNDDDAYNNW